MPRFARALRSGWIPLLLAALLLGGCSALSFVYMNAATLGVLWIDRALDLPAAHKALLGDAAEAVHQWHKGAPAEELAGFLRAARERLSGPVAQADGEWIVAGAQEQVRRVGDRLAREYGPRMPPFSDDELSRVARRLTERREAFAEELGLGDPARERVLRIERIEEAIDDWLGSVTAEQRELVVGSAAVLRFDPGLWLAERARREAELL